MSSTTSYARFGQAKDMCFVPGCLPVRKYGSSGSFPSCHELQLQRPREPEAMRIIYVTSSLPHVKKKEEKLPLDARYFRLGRLPNLAWRHRSAMRKGAPVR